MARTRHQKQTAAENTVKEKWLTLIPAYGRDYKTAEAVLKDWQGGKDFLIQDVSSPWNGKYTSCRDGGTGESQYNVARIRYLRLGNIAIIKLQPDGTWKLTGKSDGDDRQYVIVARGKYLLGDERTGEVEWSDDDKLAKRFDTSEEALRYAEEKGLSPAHPWAVEEAPELYE